MANEPDIGYLIQLNNETREGYQYPVSQDYLIGSSVQCNLKIVGENILDQHCRIAIVEDKVCVFSLSSQNPIFLNNEPVSEEGKPLNDQDKIRINDDHQLEWKSVTHRKICSRSLPLENELSSINVNARYSDSALTVWKNENRPEVSTEDTNVAPQNPVAEQEDEVVIVDDTTEVLKTDAIEKSNVSISCEINRSSAECGSKIKCSENTPVKSRKSKNPVSPFRVSNTFVPDSKNDISKSLHRDDNDEMDLECSTKNIAEDEYEDLVMHQSTSQKPFHSTPKAVSASKIRKNTRPSSSSFIDLHLQTTVEIDSSKLQTCDDKSEKMAESNEKSTSKSFNHDEVKKPASASKKNISTPTKRASESLNESRRNTRGRTSMLRKTFEENSCDNDVKSFTTPEKLTDSNITQVLFAGDSEMENVTETITDYKSLNESSKAGFASASDENDTCETSFIDKYGMCNVVKNGPVSRPSMEKCTRNLSDFSPPENNRSQEFMDSMVSTPQKNASPQHESIADSATSILSNTKDTSFDGSMNVSVSSARKRRSTGFVPFVGTPSNEYRVTRKMSTPFGRSTFGRTSVDFDIGSSRDGKHSSERSSTPFKAPPGKSSIRDSISCQPTIQESVSFEELEANNHEHDSINDSKFRNITKRRGRRRFGESIFAAEDKILEESELKSDASELDGDCSYDEENTEVSITQTSTFLEGGDELSADDKTKTEIIKNPSELKSILTPGPKSMVSKEKSVKRVTFACPSSPESAASVDESFAMINSWKPNSGSKQSSNSDCAISDEELHVSDHQETDPSFNTASEPEDDSSVTNSAEEKCDESSLNVTGVEYLANIQSNLNDLSGVEQIQSPEPSPIKCSTETDNDVAEPEEKTDTLNEAPERSPANFTEMESSLGFSEPSNRSNIVTETNSEVESLKEISQIAVDKNLDSSSTSTKISCSPGVHLSGVKSLFNTPEKSRSSVIDKGIKCNLNFNILPSPKTKGKTGPKLKSASASKSIGTIGTTKQTASVKSSRLCKSLILDEMTSLKRETKPVDEIQVEKSDVTVETPGNETVTRDLSNDAEQSDVTVETLENKTVTRELSDDVETAKNETDLSNDEVTSAEPVTESESVNEKRTANHEIPEIVVTEATFVNENTLEEQMELTEDREEEVIESSKAESSSEVQFDDDTAEFETSDFEDKFNSDQDDILSTEGDTTEMTDDGTSPVITQIRRIAALKAQSDSKIILSDDKIDDEIQSEENKLSATISFAENEPEKEVESNTSYNVVPSVPDVVLPSSECTEELAPKLQSSSEGITLDQNCSQISDVFSSEYTDDVDSSKTTIGESSCNNSQLTDSSAKDTSDLDSLKINMNESCCNISQLSDSSTKHSNDSDTWKKNPVDVIFDHQCTNLLFDDETVGGDLSESHIEEPIRAELSKNNANVRTKIIECLSAEDIAQDIITKNAPESEDTEPCDPNLNVSQSTASSQEMGIRIDASSALINDLHKVLEDTPHPSIPSSVEATPKETFKPISFPDSTNISSIDCTSATRPDLSTKPNLPSAKIIDEVFTPIKTYVRGSSTPQSAVRRCRKSSRIHRCNMDDSVNKPCTSVHDCSIVLDSSLTKTDAETAQEPREAYKQVVAELDVQLVGVKEKIDGLQKSPAKENDPSTLVNDCSIVSDSSQTKYDAETVEELTGIEEKIDKVQKSPAKEESPEKINESVPCSESVLSADPTSSVPSGQSSEDENIVSTYSTDMFTTIDDSLEHQSVDKTAQSTCVKQEEPSTVPEITLETSEIKIIEVDHPPVYQISSPESTCVEQEEPSSVPEITVETSEIPNITESIEQSKTLSIILVANEEADLELTHTLSVDAIPDKRRSLRTRKKLSAAPVTDVPKQGVVTRNRQKAPSLWYKNHFHCYLCLNYPETFNKCVRKTKMKQLEQELNESYDDKENVCSVLKVADKSKKMELSSEQISATEPAVKEKKGRKPRRLKNVENIAAEPDSEQDEDFRSCSIVLPVLDPEIIKSPVKVDESGNISLVEEPPVAPKRKRAARTANTIQPKPSPTTSRTRQKPAKTVSFDVSQNKSDQVEQPVEKGVRSKATASRRNLRNQQNTVEPEKLTRSRKTAANNQIEPEETLVVARTIEIQLEPVNVDTVLSESIEKKTRSRRGTLAAKNDEKVEETTVKVRASRATKRIPEPVEDEPELPKKKRGRSKATVEVSAKEVAKPKNEDEIVTELPKRTRGQAKTTVQVTAPSPVNTVAKSTKATRSKPVENTDSVASSVSKKRSRDVGESSTNNGAEKPNKKTKILKNVEIVPDKPIESVPAKKPAKKVNLAKEPVASTSKVTSPRVTRSRKTAIIKHEDIVPVKNPPKETRTRKKTVAAPKSSPTTNVNNSANSKHADVVKSPPKEKVAPKRAVVTRSKNVSIKKGRISTTLKTSVARKSLGDPILPENNLPAAKQRSTRRRAK